VGSIDVVRSDLLNFEWKVGKYFAGQNIKRNGVLPNPKFPKTSVDVFSIHNAFM
jgi:hypothetical protein